MRRDYMHLPERLLLHHVNGSESLGGLLNLIFDGVAFVEGLIAIALDRLVVNKNVPAAVVLLNESETLG